MDETGEETTVVIYKNPMRELGQFERDKDILLQLKRVVQGV